MTDITGKVGYIRGLLDGLKLDKDNDTTKVLTAIADALTDIAHEVVMLKAEYDELNEYVEQIDDDLAELESIQTDADEDNIIDDDWSAPYFEHDDTEDDDDDDDGDDDDE